MPSPQPSSLQRANCRRSLRLLIANWIAVLTVASSALSFADDRDQLKPIHPPERMAPFERAGDVAGSARSETSPFSHDGSRFITRLDGATVRVWDAQTREPRS